VKKTIEVEVDEHGAFNGVELRQQGVLSYDQPLVATATARSAITYIDGEAGILRYRGYPIEQLAEQKHFLEVAHLLARGELASEAERGPWRDAVYDADVDLARIRTHVESFPEGSHPMAILISGYAALGASHPETKDVKDAEMRHRFFPLVLAETLLLGAHAIARHAHAQPGEPTGDTYARRFLGACGDAVDTSRGTEALDVFGRALDVLFVLHADHELNAGTNAMRAIGSAETDMYSSLAGAAAALYGPLHGGANEAVLRMLRRIGSVDKVPDFIEGVKNGKERLMGFGHRVYKNYDPRAKIIKKACDDVFEVTGVNPLLKIAQELEKIALEDEYFVKRKLYPNVDFYSGLIYEAFQFPPEMFTVLFAIGRTPGWLAQWLELVQDKEQKIARPKQIYTGARTLDFTPAAPRWA
jgi:citrate synthase